MTPRFRELSLEEAAEVAALRDRVLARPRHPDDYVPHDEEDAFLIAHLGHAGVCIGIEVGRRLVGFSALTLDIERAHVDVELRDAITARGAAAEETCVLAVTMLEHGFRGMGLHRRAIDHRLAIARSVGRRRAVAIVSPFNTPSLCNLVRRKGRVEGVLDFAGARVRYLIAFGWEGATPNGMEKPELLPVTDFARIRRLLREGCVGDAIVFEGGRPHLRLTPASKGAPPA